MRPAPARSWSRRIPGIARPQHRPGSMVSGIYLATDRPAPAHSLPAAMRLQLMRRQALPRRSEFGMETCADASEDIPRCDAKNAILIVLAGNPSAFNLAEFRGEQQIGAR